MNSELKTARQRGDNDLELVRFAFPVVGAANLVAAALRLRRT